MNALEKELRKMFENTTNIKDAVFCGAKMIGSISSTLRAKVELACTHVQGQYNAIRVTIINREEGTVDSTTFLFKDIIGLKNNYDPYIWEKTLSPGWYGFSPADSERNNIVNTVSRYIDLFADPLYLTVTHLDILTKENQICGN